MRSHVAPEGRGSRQHQRHGPASGIDAPVVPVFRPAQPNRPLQSVLASLERGLRQLQAAAIAPERISHVAILKAEQALQRQVGRLVLVHFFWAGVGPGAMN